ncbi:MAG: nitrous oxide reductase family maturation protein NosD [Planctomycetota bacterium]
MRLSPILSVLALTSVPAFAQDVIVPDQFTTIQAAVNGATDVNGNGTVEIFVRNGNYAENVFVQRSNLSITGQSNTGTIVQGAAIRETFRVQNSASVTLRTLRIANVGTQDAIELQRTTGCRIDGNVVTNGLDGIVVNRSVATTVTGNESFGNLGTGIRLARSRETQVASNNCHDNASHGVDLSSSILNTISGNTLRANGSNGLRLTASRDNTIETNTATANLDNGFRIEDGSSANTLRSNTGSNNRENGLRMRDTANNLVTLNTFQQNGEYGIRRRDWSNDDFNGGVAGVQNPLGDNVVSGNVLGSLRED